MRLSLVLTLLTLTALPAAAQQLSPMTGTTAAPPAMGGPAAPGAPALRPRMTQRDRFEAANTTHDGHLTRDQAEAGHMRMVARNFDAIDTAHHGYVTMDDIRAYNRARRQARKAAQQGGAQRQQ